ncbi:GNAT family N-acetyltransferase [Haloarchaeobius sp. HRN-SO-5]|uniref:GNAT family N-acetyltransferase n=1 Tax=Haloarchaeobius sp. HRN-SO-5 TaxID=3446118 RepID=UPI003EBD7608
MQIREATADDFESMRALASASLHDSYESIFDPSTIDTAVEEWYGDDLLSDQVATDDAVVLVGEADDGLAAFSQSELVGDAPVEGRILWLHVDPDHRGHGYGSRLLTETRETLLDHGAQRITGVVLEGNRIGNEFYEAHGFEQAGERTVDVGDESFVENVFVEASNDRGEWEAVEAVETEDGDLFVNYAEPHRGSEGPFYEAYRDEERERHFGLFCAVCNSTDVAMGTMEEVVCNVCGNRRKATRWDASYL